MRVKVQLKDSDFRVQFKKISLSDVEWPEEKHFTTVAKDVTMRLNLAEAIRLFTIFNNVEELTFEVR